jgi:hypothetical protein
MEQNSKPRELMLIFNFAFFGFSNLRFAWELGFGA